MQSKEIMDAIENESEFYANMDDLAAEIEALGVPVDIPYAFCDIPVFEGYETAGEYESALWGDDDYGWDEYPEEEEEIEDILDLYHPC